jgi:nucleotide-binding universal stress UspA family protein
MSVDAASLVIAATDGSDASIEALRSGLAVMPSGARVLIVTVVPPPDMSLVVGSGIAGGVMTFDEQSQMMSEQHGAAEALLARTVDELALADAEVAVLEGDPAREICRAAAEHGATAIVLGTRGRGGVARFFLGSVALDVVRNAPCPVLTVGA